LNWIKDSNDNLFANVNIFKIEDMNIHNFLKNVIGLTNIDTNTRVHATQHEHYSKYYNDESIQLVALHYNDDIKEFSYKFEKNN
jgi:hypothetical protein